MATPAYHSGFSIICGLGLTLSPYLVEGMGFYWGSPALETCTDDFHNGASMAGIIKESFPQFSLFISLSLWRKRHQQIPSSYTARSLPELAPDV